VIGQTVGTDNAPDSPEPTAERRSESRKSKAESRESRIVVARVLFVAGLLAWASLTAWWALYFHISFQQTRAATLRAYAAEERLAAVALHASVIEPDVLLARTPFTLAPLPLADEVLEFPTMPIGGAAGNLALVLRPEERDRLRSEARRKGAMLAGEGSVLVLLMLGMLVALYRMLIGEWRLARQTESFMHAVTHQLRSPLAGLRALLQSLSTIRLAPEERDTYLRMGLQEVERLDHLVGNILLSSRIESRVFRPRVESVDLAGALEKLRARKELQFRERGGSLQAQAAPGATASCDPEALETILENLVDNAFKYAGRSPVVRLAAGREGLFARVVVEDEGPGLAPEEREKVFQRFYRARRGEGENARGTGLGLHIARSLARACGGELRAEGGTGGRGARFVLALRA